MIKLYHSIVFSQGQEVNKITTRHIPKSGLESGVWNWSLEFGLDFELCIKN